MLVWPVAGKGNPMKLHMILVFGLVLGVVGCAKEEAAAPEVELAAPESAPSGGQDAVWRNAEFIEHMHVHAEKLDELNFALADGDLETAKASANWLSTHDTNTDIQSNWMPYLYAMRSEAEAVEAAPDIETAQAAAQRITLQCQECHVAVGVGLQ